VEQSANPFTTSRAALQEIVARFMSYKTLDFQFFVKPTEMGGFECSEEIAEKHGDSFQD
jgi:hypothetical protein